MATSIETKIVELKFNNDNFADKVDSTLTKLEQLNDQIKEVGVKEAFKNLSKGIKDVDVSSVSKGVEEVNKGFSKMEVVGMTALVNISNAAVNLGKRLISNLVTPLTKGVIQGGLSRAKNIEQANFSFEGQKIGKSDESLSYYKEVMDAVLGTSYSYDVAAKAASQLAASNVGVIDTERKLADGSTITAKVLNSGMTDALLGIAGVAAMTGSDFDSISQIFTRVAGQGRVMANDLNSIASRGLNAAATLSAYINGVNDGTIKVSDSMKAAVQEITTSTEVTEGDLRDFVSDSLISFDIFSDAMSKAFGQHAKDSTLTFQGALDDVNAALARIGADFYDHALDAGRDILNSVTPLVDAVHDKIQNSLDATGSLMDRTSKSLSRYLDLFSYLIQLYPDKGKDMNEWIDDHMNAWTNIADIFKKGYIDGNIVSIISSLKGFTSSLGWGENQKGIDGWKMVADYLHVTKKEAKELGKSGAIDINTFYKSFHKLWSESTDLMAIEDANSQFNSYLKSMIAATGESKLFNDQIDTFFSILNGGRSLISSFVTIFEGIGSIFLTVAKHLSPLGQLFLDITEETAKFVVKIADLLATSESFSRIIDGITSLITKIFSFIDVGKLCTAILDGITKAFDFMSLAVDRVYSGVSKVIGAISNVLKTIADKVHSIITNTEELAKILKALKGAGIIVMVTRIALALTRPAEILETIRNGVKNVSVSIDTVLTTFRGFFYNLGKIGKNINLFIFELTTTLKRLQELVIATAILEIAFAVGALAAAIYFLSKVNIEGANSSVLALIEVLTIVMTLVGSAVVLKKKVVSKVKIWEKTSESVKDIAKAFVLMAVSVLIIAAAIKLLSTIKTEDMVVAFAVIEVLLMTMTGIAKLLATKYTFTINKSGLNRSASGMTKGLWQLIAMAVAIRIVAKAIVAIAKEADINAVWSALGIVEAIMWSMAAIVKLLSSDKTTKMAKGALGLLAMAVAVRLLTKPIIELSQIASMDNDALWSAAIAVGALMTVMTLLMKMMSGSKGLVKAGASLVLMAYAIKVLSDVVLTFSSLDPESMFVAIGGIAAALFSMVIALALINPKGIIVKVLAIYLIVQALQTLSDIVMEFGANNEVAWAGIIDAAIALAVLAGACYGFSKVPIGGILKLFLTLSLGAVVVIEFGVAIGIFGAGLVIFGMGLSVLADSAKKAQEVGGTIVGIMAGFAIAIGILSSVGLPAVGIILALAAAFILFGIGMQKVGTGMNDLAVAVQILAEMEGELGTTAKSITDFIKDLKKLKEEASDIGASFKSIADPLKEIKKAASTISDEIEKLVKSYTDAVEKSSECITQLADALISISKLNQDSFANAAEAVNTFIQELGGLSNDSEKVATISSDISSNIDVMKTAFDEIVSAVGNFKSLSYQTFEQLANSLNNIINPIKTLKELSSSFDTLSNDLADFISSLGTMKNNAASVEEGATSIAEALEKVGNSANLAKNSFEGLTKRTVNILTDMGSGLEAMGKGIAVIVENKDGLSGAASSISDFYNRLSEVNTLADSIANGTRAVASAIKTLGSAASKTAALSKTSMKESGAKMVDGLISGIKSKSSDLTTKVNTIVTDAGTKIRNKRNEWFSIGSYLIGGMISGLASQQTALELQVQKMEAAAERAVKAKAKINSPSKVWMEIGAGLGEGFVLGIKNSENDVEAASIGLAAVSEKAMESALMSISGAIYDDFELNPTITPVVDLTNVRNGAEFANSALSSSIFGGRGNSLTASISHTIQNGRRSDMAKSMNDLANQIGEMTDTMNSRSLNNYINIDGSTDPEAFADGLLRSFRLNARTV